MTPYDFSVADLRAAADVVAAAAASSGPGAPDWQQLLGLLQVIYGGRVSSKHDAKVRQLLAALRSHMLYSLLVCNSTTSVSLPLQAASRFAFFS